MLWTGLDLLWTGRLRLPFANLSRLLAVADELLADPANLEGEDEMKDEDVKDEK